MSLNAALSSVLHGGAGIQVLLGCSRRQRGAASLVVVLMLFFVIALVSAYTSRNLIFEQRTSVNQYRSSMAFEAAEAGIEWAIAMLNGGRIGNDCTEATATAADTSFRQRYLNFNGTDGTIAPRTNAGAAGGVLAPSCVWSGTAWVCDCPRDADAALVAPTSPGLHPAFRLRFNPATRAGVVRVEVTGCVRMTDACMNVTTLTPVDSEGRAQHTVLLALKPAVTTLPAAALTVVGNLTGGGAATVQNADFASGGITIQAAGDVPGGFTLRSTPGTPSSLSVRKNDSALVPKGLTLGDLLALPAVPLNWDRVFGSTFGLMPATYRDQPAVRILDCPVAGCRAALAALVAANPDRVIWIPGDLTLETAGDVGSLPDPANLAAAGPATIVVQGRVNFLTPGVNIFGVVYSRNGDWGGSGTIRGAALVEGNLAAAAAPTVIYEPSVVNATRFSSGSFVPLQGDWRDFR